jgi:hypothetical protein
MKNVTVTLDDQTAEWARAHAAERGMSLSRYIGELLRQQLPKAQAYEQAMQRYMSNQWTLPLRDPDERLPTREEIYDRPVFRRR